MTGAPQVGNITARDNVDWSYGGRVLCWQPYDLYACACRSSLFHMSWCSRVYKPFTFRTISSVCIPKLSVSLINIYCVLLLCCFALLLRRVVCCSGNNVIQFASPN